MSKAASVKWDEAFKEEVDLLKTRKQGSGDVETNAVGLAISGGGIRSATFALGVLEGLKKLKLLPKIDYLSTVSGGGYIGAWLSANCKRAADHGEVSWLEDNADWDQSVRYLRSYSNYLSPQLGFLSADTWSMAAIWFRNTLLVQLTVILGIATALLLPRLAYPVFKYWPHAGDLRWASIFLFLLGAVGIAGNTLRLSRRKDDVPFLHADHWKGGLLGAIVFLGAAVAIIWATHFQPFLELSAVNRNVPLLPSLPIAFLLTAGCFCLQPVVVRALGWVLKRFVVASAVPKQVNYTQAWVQGLVVIPMMIVGSLVGAILWGESLLGNHAKDALSTLGSYSALFMGAWHFWPFPLGVVFASLWLFSICSIRDFKQWKCWAAALLAPLPAMVVLHALLSGIMLLMHSWIGKGEEGHWLAYVWAPPMVLYSFSLTVVVLIGMLGRQSSEGVREWWSRFGAWLGIYGFGWMLISTAVAYGPLLSAVLFQKSTWGWGASLGGGWVATTLAGLFAGNSDSTGKPAEKSTRDLVIEVVARIAPFVFIAGLLVAISTILHLLIVSNSGCTWADAAELQQDHWSLMNGADRNAVFAVFAVCLCAFLVLAWRVDINEFSLNAFYRNRLIRCYLGATRFRASDKRNPQHFTGFDEKDDMNVSCLASAQKNTPPEGPFHIVNCALNLGGSKDLALHTRHSASFTLTPLHCGSEYESDDKTAKPQQIGYTPTSIYGGKDIQPTLGLAISVSGAAASPNMGYHTSPVVAFLMTLFDVRLGWWFPNPRMGVKGASPLFSLRYLLMELFGGANDKSSYLAISDGGHFENLAAYELVKRKCRLIIISDGECDPLLRFEGLGTLIRVCAVDFGAVIKIDVNSLRPGASGWSSRRCAVGTIDYGDCNPGTLIYLKASMTGEEETDILQYKSGHPAFPHESTGNQFYSEDQFESYRGLGRDIAIRAFKPVEGEQNLKDLAFKMRQIYSPALHDARKFTSQSQRLMDLWSKLSQDPNLDFLDREMSASWPDMPDSDFRSTFYFCCQILHFMESVYIDFRLEDQWDHADNAGWREMFQQWARSPEIRQTWEQTANTYGLRFQYFCERRLNMPLPKKVMAATGPE